MRSFPFGPTGGASSGHDDDALELTGGMPPPARQDDDPARDDDYGAYTTNLPVVQRPSRWRWVTREEFAALSGHEFWWPLVVYLADRADRADRAD